MANVTEVELQSDVKRFLLKIKARLTTQHKRDGTIVCIAFASKR